MSEIRLFTVVYNENGDFLIGLKNKKSYFGIVDDGIQRDIERVYLDIEIALNDAVAIDIRDKTKSLLKDLKILQNSLEENILQRYISEGEQLIRSLRRKDKDESAVYTEKIQELKVYLNKLLHVISRMIITPYEGGVITFPSQNLEGNWTDYFEEKTIKNCGHPSKNVINEIKFTQDCDNKICFDLPKVEKKSISSTLWIVKDVCALKALLRNSVDTFKNQLGGYDLFQQIVNEYDMTNKTLKESKVISIEVKVITEKVEERTNRISSGQVAIYIKLEQDSFTHLQQQVNEALALGAQYANEIQQGLYDNEGIDTSVSPKVNTFNRIIEHQNIYNWSPDKLPKRPDNNLLFPVSNFAEKAIEKLKKLELIIKGANKEKTNHKENLVALKEQIDLLVASNKTTIKEIMDSYNGDSIQPFDENDNSEGKSKANYSLYQIINQFNYLLINMNTGEQVIDNEIERILEIPRLNNEYQTIKEAACSDRVKEIPGVTECINDDSSCEVLLKYCYSNPKIEKNIFPQVNKEYQLLMLDTQDDTLNQEIEALQDRVVDQRSWQSFIIDMREASTIKPKKKVAEASPNKNNNANETNTVNDSKKTVNVKPEKKMKQSSKRNTISLSKNY